MKYLVAHDIACPRRLRRAAGVLARHAVRIQKSVYLLPAGGVTPAALLDLLAPLLDHGEDLLQVWRLADAGGVPHASIGDSPARPAAAAVLGPGPPLTASPRPRAPVFME